MKTIISILLLLSVLQTTPVQARERIALVIGNSNYNSLKRLANPGNDAREVGASLRNLGFHLVKNKVLYNLNEIDFLNAITQFSRESQGAEMALVYYAGHGVQIGQKSYLLPTDTPKNITLVSRRAIALSRVLSQLKGKAELSIAIFDACREIPQLQDEANRAGFGGNLRAFGRPRITGSNQIIAYATAEGEYAKDGTGQHSPYTQALLNRLNTSTEDVRTLFDQVAYDVSQKTGQVPDVTAKAVRPNTYYFRQPHSAEKLRLTINTSPQDARIRILNIRPAYQAGMLLATNKDYQIEVTAPGYQRQLKTVRYNAGGEQILSVVLTALPGAQAASNTTSSIHHKPTDRQNGIDMVWVEPGCFRMGSDKGDDDEKPVHRVCLSQGYYMGKYEVTQAQWEKVMGHNPSSFKGKNHPVEKVSWDDVQEFIAKLNTQSGLHYRLPTEAEWEYACRSGGKDQKYCGGNELDSLAWYRKNSNGKTHSVGSKQANDLGIYDMSGNVWEWVSDWYGKDYYRHSPTNDPKGPATGRNRVNRGGSWNLNAYYLRSANRNFYSPDYRDYNLGFRLVRQP